MGCFITDELSVLEDLQLVWCCHRFGRLTSSSLKNLVINNGNPNFSVGAMVLAVPRVASLRISNSMHPVTSEGKMPLVVAASLTHRACALGLLGSVRGARSLDLRKVSARALPLLQGVKDPVFPNLTTLHLYDCDRRYLYDYEFCFSDYSRGGTTAFLSRLRTLHLSRVTLTEEFQYFIADDLPVLEDLQLVECSHEFDRIASGSHKNLVIDDWKLRFSVHELVLAVPHVAFLHVLPGSSLPVASECEMASVVAASLTHQAAALCLLGSVRSARSLDLSKVSATAPFLHSVEDMVFPNLRTLRLYECDVGVLRHFLQNAPKLERIIVRYGRSAGGSSRTKKFSNWYGSNKAYGCKNLKSVELEFYEDRDVSELNDALDDILRERVLPIETSTRHGKRKVKILYK